MAKIGLMASTDVSVRNMEYVTYEIASILSAQHQVDILGADITSARISDQFRVFPPQKGWYDSALSWRARQLRHYIKTERPDALIALGSIGINGLAVAQAGKQMNIPTAVRLTSDVFRVWRTKEGFIGKVNLYIRNNILGRRAMRLADKIILLHDAQRKDLKKFSDKLITAPQPVTFPSDTFNDIRAELNIPKEVYLALSTMRLDGNKRVDMLANVILNTPNTRFVIIGDGNRKAWLQHRTATCKHVTFIDQVPRNMLAPYYKAADVVLHMSDSEGLSNIMLEALYFKTPVLATESGAITRALISNICETPAAFTQALTNRTAKLDPLPETVRPEVNHPLWLDVATQLLPSETTPATTVRRTG